MSFDDPSPRLPPTRSERQLLACFALVIGGLFFAELLSQYDPRKASIVFVFAFWVPLLVLHEVGHALAARALGWQVPEMVIGFGRELFRFRVGATSVRVRVLPVEGYVVPQPDRVAGARWKSACIYLAGPGIELLLVLVLWLALGPELFARSQDYERVAVQSLALAALLGAGFNLLPYRSGSGVSDGLGAWLSLFASDESFRLRLASYRVNQARQALYLERWQSALTLIEEGLQEHPDDEQLLGLRAVALAGEGDEPAAVALLESLGHPNDKSAGLRHELLLDAAWVVLASHDESLLHDAQQACERALESGPESLRAHLMLGHVLLERGQYQQASGHLMRAYRQASDEPEEPRLLALLAIAARSEQHLDYAQRFLAALDPSQLGPELRERALYTNPTAEPR